jgi:hypothetical protein
MLSKLTLLSALAGTSQALITGSAAYTGSETCTTCVVNNHKWCSDPAVVYTSVATPAIDQCQEVTTACSGVTSFSLRDISNKDLELAACENSDTMCGTQTYDITTSSGT